MCLWISDVSKEMWDTENFNKYSSKLTENFKGIVLKTPLILNVNCAKIQAKKLDFIACVKSIKKSFWMMYSNQCLSFRETVPLTELLGSWFQGVFLVILSVVEFTIEIITYDYPGFSKPREFLADYFLYSTNIDYWILAPFPAKPWVFQILGYTLGIWSFLCV